VGAAALCAVSTKGSGVSKSQQWAIALLREGRFQTEWQRKTRTFSWETEKMRHPSPVSSRRVCHPPSYDRVRIAREKVKVIFVPYFAPTTFQ